MTGYSPEDYSKYRIQRAKETINEVRTLVENGFWNTSVNRMYYACFYAVGALLIKHGIHTSTHAGLRQKFGQEYVKTGLISRGLAKHYADLFEKRHKGDYNDFYDYDKETVDRLFPFTVEFIEKIEELLNK